MEQIYYTAGQCFIWTFDYFEIVETLQALQIVQAKFSFKKCLVYSFVFILFSV